jgi:hypothetical protein
LSFLHLRARYVTAGFLLLAILSTMSAPGHAATLPSASVQNNFLNFTINPDQTVGINWNSTTFSSILQNQSAAFPPGYAIQSSSSFSKQSSGIVETTRFQYTIPLQTYTAQPSLIAINSINLTASQTGTTKQGSLSIETILPLQQLTIQFIKTSNRISANATAQVTFSSSSVYYNTPVANQTSWDNTWANTFGNQTYTDRIAGQLQNSTYQILFVKNLNSTNVSNPSSATATVEFVAIPGGSATSFLAAFENIINPLTKMPTAVDSIIQSVLNLVTGETVSLTYSYSTRMLSFKSSITFVSELDAQLNSIKSQYFALLNKTMITPQDTFLNQTSITVSGMSMQSSLDLNTGTYNSNLIGTVITPPTSGSNNNFTIPGLFTTIGSTNSSGPGMNITLTGGSDSSNQVKVIVPTGTPTPTSTTSNSATWMNLQNASELANVRFEVQPVPFSVIGFLTSTTGFILEAIIAVVVIAGLALYARKRRSRMSTPLATSGPTSSPGFGPSPAPPTQSQ